MSETKPLPEIIRSVVPIVGLSHSDGKLAADRRFCPECGQESLGETSVMGFTCSAAGCDYSGPRALSFRKNARFRIDEKAGALYHYSVGAAVFSRFHEEEEDRILLLRRATHPVGAFTIPSGHWDVDDDRPQEAAEREVTEETGLESHMLGDWKLVSEPDELVEEGCRRGCDLHHWHFYQTRCGPDQARLRLPTDVARCVIGESDMIGWIPVSQVRDGMFKLTKPAAHFLARIIDIRVRHALER
jgi:ADP-ribose pyrophosphatase YjhB (NUDIX family)